MSSDTKLSSNEMLNAFVDGDLDASDYLEILALSQKDTAVAQTLADIQMSKRLVRMAYKQIPPPPVTSTTRNYQRPYQAVAVFLIVLVSASSGWLAGKHQAAEDPVISQFANAENATPKAVGNDGAIEHVVLHLISADPEKMSASLDQAELILAGSEYTSQPAQVDIVANGPGLALFRADTSPYKERIAKLKRSYPSLSLIACARAIQNLQQQGINVEILPGVDTGSRANERINTRSMQGWDYEVI